MKKANYRFNEEAFTQHSIQKTRREEEPPEEDLLMGLFSDANTGF